ncbi:hypothetical protein [Streptomyces sp. A1-5]|uniref:hypothetical protein n=1 Tax=Streptomyces sp. A1-5 TaxID=2738410 RepID=UPI001F15D0F0|nr:hypothetical protein [Streptomyces sp. A1-5]UJB45729.1 hypothetical protein HRD51_37575 [Streptomyces sp. A1-5]
MGEATLILRAELYREADDTFSVEIIDPATGTTERQPIPAQYAAMLPQVLAMLG